MSLYEKVVAFVDTSFHNVLQKRHFERTVFWFERFLPGLTEAHRIAGYAHDSERAFRDETKKVPQNYLDADFLKYHCEKGAEIIGMFLFKNGASEADIEKVKHLISGHECGGDLEQNALMDADSVSYFETAVEMFVSKRASIQGYEKIKEKLDWMFNRISIPERKAFATENYKKWSTELEKYRENI